MKDENIKKGIAWLLFSAFGFSMMGMFVKAAGDIPFIQKTLFRNSVAFIIAFTTLIIHARKDKSILHIEKRAYLWLFLRCVIGVTGIFGNFYAIGKLKLGDAAMLQKIKELDSRYNVYFRQHPYIPAWESNFYAVKE